MVTFELVIVLVMLGAVVGVLAGLLGIGGGLIIVPSLLFLLPMFGIDADVAMQMALATSLACIIITSSSSAFNHYRVNNVDVFVVKFLIPGIILGGFIGSFVAEFLPSQYLPPIFGCIVLGLSVRMFLSIRSTRTKRTLGVTNSFISGASIGTISSLAGIGGGSLLVPFLNRHGIEMRKAVGTSSFCSALLATSGMLGFVFHGASSDALPAHSFGYVYLPALFAIASSSILTSKLGVRLTTILPTVILKKIFAVLLLLIAVRMLLF
ncbi:sulfite exporter TauE/SafE family protein [Vibrio rarus]|uniref:sulfite exporter TauE/SafE family protein n=1 Tax=Vibrio rarus TaxID=413403 RepID=UPI0021C45B94|nr:sulfite exporter TauE/SafE family protein [Vibrio rarus]